MGGKPNKIAMKMRAVLAMLKKRKPRKLSLSRGLLAIDGEDVAVTVRLNPRARRMVMRVNPVTGEVNVTAPARVGRAAALEFVRGETGWVRSQRQAAPKQVALAPGALVPFMGRPHRICEAAGRGPAPVWRQGDEIFVSGRAEHAARRLIDFFKRAAREEFEHNALAFGTRLGVRPARITLRDTSSRWGSCSSARSLSFSWRLIFAPDYVREYVVAHEAAHLREMNHGPRFWAHVESLTPHGRKARRWLRENGRNLLSV
jgi:predicted metal-dependent hydrolase